MLSSLWTSFLKLIALYNGDLSSLTAPAFILGDTSLTEFLQYWAEHQDLLLAPAFLPQTNDADSAERDQMAVTRWFILTLRLQYCSRSESKGLEKKPFNPLLGEVFVGRWENSAKPELGETILLSEQVLHHPPVTAYAIVNATNKVTLQGYNNIRALVLKTGALNVKQYGHAVLEYGTTGSSFLITLPPLHIEGMLLTAPFVELDLKAYIQGLSGYVTVIEFLGRGYLSGKKNLFKARMYKSVALLGDKKNALYTIEGQWSGVLVVAPGAEAKKGGELFYDAAEAKSELVVKPIADEHPLEARRVWQTVAEAIRAGDTATASKVKTEMEDKQRQEAAARAEAGELWTPRWFVEKNYAEAEERDDAFLKLTKLGSLSNKNLPSGTTKAKETGGETAVHWRWAPARWEAETEVKA